MFTISSDLATEIAWLGIFIKITILLASAWLIYYLIPSHRVRWHVAAWRVFAISIVCLPLMTFIMPKYPITLIAWQEESVINADALPGKLDKLEKKANSVSPENDQPREALQPGENTIHSSIQPSPYPGVPTDENVRNPILFGFFDDWLTAIFFVWIMGTLLFMIRILHHQYKIIQEITISELADSSIQNICQKTARAIGYSSDVPVRVSPQSAIPYIYGCFNPVIVIPERMAKPDATSDLPSIFAHELSHIRNNDLFWMACFRFLHAFLWIHPLVWGMRSAHEKSCEYASDEYAAYALGNADCYAGVLAKIALEISGQAYSTLNAAPMVRSSKITSRLKRITSGIPLFPLSIEWVGCFVFFWLLLVSSASMFDIAHAKEKESTPFISASPVSEDNKAERPEVATTPKNIPGKGLEARFIPKRPPEAGESTIDLSEYYNAGLQGTWQTNNSVRPETLKELDNDLADLPVGILTLAGIPFDIRGVIQLQGQQLKNEGAVYPEKIEGIKIGFSFQQLHVLHAASWQEEFNTPAGSYILNYADGSMHEFKIIYGKHLLDWWKYRKEEFEPENTVVAWTGTNDLARPIVRSQRNVKKAQVEKFLLTIFGMNTQEQKNAIEAGENPIRLFKTTWENPYPEKEVVCIDYVSKMSDCAPFLVAMTVK